MPATVLVCDNEDVLRTLVRAALGNLGYEIAEARDGEESLEVARRTNPDLIILDMLMPGRSGLQVLSELRRDPTFARTPVIVLTARAHASDREAAFRADADRFLPKPFSPRELVALVDELLAAAVAKRDNGRNQEPGATSASARERWTSLARERVAWAEAHASEDEDRTLVDSVPGQRSRARPARSVEYLDRAAFDAITTVAHELRTPLTGILGLAEILLVQDVGPDVRRRNLETIHGEVKRLTALVDTLLDLERLRDHQLALDPGPFELDRLLRESAQLFAVQSAAHTIELDLPPEPLEVVADRDRIAQVVSNLLSNAIKYSPSGGTVRLSAQRLDGHVRVSVADPGIGIPADQQDRVFSRFFRAQSTGAREVQGFGLGLALSLEIVAAHRGEMGFESVEGQGSGFWFELPSR